MRPVRLQNTHINHTNTHLQPTQAAHRQSHTPPHHPNTVSQEYNIIHRTLRWLHRIRHRCGYGVHSPLAFNFITDVVYNQDTYYAYHTLRQQLTPSIARLDEYDPQSGLTDKDLRLIFRLTNYQEPTHIYIICAHDSGKSAPEGGKSAPEGGSPSPALLSYIRAARPSAHITSPHTYTTPPHPHDEDHHTRELHYVDTPDLLPTSYTLPDGAMLILRGIHRTHKTLARWNQLKDSPHTTITFDLGRFAVALNRPKITPQDYIVNYF